MRDVTVEDAMTRSVWTVHPSDSLEKAMSVLRRNGISGLPVTDTRGVVVGVLSEKDIARVLSESLGENSSYLLEVLVHTSPRAGRQKPNPRVADGEAKEIIRSTLTSVTVAEAMSPDPVVIGPEAPLDSAARILKERGINRLPVVERGKLVGILTRHDVLSAWI